MYRLACLLMLTALMTSNIGCVQTRANVAQQSFEANVVGSISPADQSPNVSATATYRATW